MIHEMGLHHEYFKAIKAGERKVEVRLNDRNKQKIKIGDKIEFLNFPDQDEAMQVKVICLKRYEKFVDLYHDIPLEYFTSKNLAIKEMLDETYEIYDAKLEEQWGVLAILIEYEGIQAY